jgi:DNA transposition AAA+ family ATPase
MSILDTFNQARELKVPFAIDGETGMGKSYAAEMYLKQFPTNTFIVTCDDDLTAKSFMNELAFSVGVKPLGAAYNIRKSVIHHLKGKRDALLIIDEAENLKDRAWGSIKRIMDDLKNTCGIVFIGANGFERMLNKKANKLINPFPQVNSRIREGGFKQLFDFEENDVLSVCKQHEITEKEVITILRNKCRNMRELAGAITKLKRAQKATPEYSIIELAKHELAA